MSKDFGKPARHFLFPSVHDPGADAPGDGAGFARLLAGADWRGGGPLRSTAFGQYLTVICVIALVTAAAFVFTPVVGAHATALVYLLTVVLLALYVDRGPALVAAALSAVLWDFCFLPPIFAFSIHSFEDAMLFGMYFVVALALGQLTARIKAQWAAEREREAQSAALRLRLSELSGRTRLLQESERLSKVLLDSMTHELRTPIAAIESASGNLLGSSEEKLTPFQRRMIAEIGEATERLDRLVGNALEMGRLESGVVKPALNECDPKELVQFCVAETGKALAQHRVRVDIGPDLPMTQMDFVLTQQALTNLLSNAALHTPAGGEVEVSARLVDGELALAVADDGPGIHPAMLPRLFEKFARGPNAPVGGAGLGLSLVKGFIEAQGGAVSAVNRPGGGAIFTIRLPLRHDLEPSPLPHS